MARRVLTEEVSAVSSFEFDQWGLPKVPGHGRSGDELLEEELSPLPSWKRRIQEQKEGVCKRAACRQSQWRRDGVVRFPHRGAAAFCNVGQKPGLHHGPGKGQHEEEAVGLDYESETSGAHSGNLSEAPAQQGRCEASSCRARRGGIGRKPWERARALGASAALQKSSSCPLGAKRLCSEEEKVARALPTLECVSCRSLSGSVFFLPPFVLCLCVCVWCFSPFLVAGGALEKACLPRPSGAVVAAESILPPLSVTEAWWVYRWSLEKKKD